MSKWLIYDSMKVLSLCDVIKYTWNVCLGTKGERNTIRKI
jgi:hypothetical protein